MEKDNGLDTGHFKLIALIECSQSALNASQIASASPRVIGMNVGRYDLQTDLGCHDLESDMMQHTLLSIAAAAKSAGQLAFFSTSCELDNFNKFENECAWAFSSGFNGRSCVTYDQVESVTPGVFVFNSCFRLWWQIVNSAFQRCPPTIHVFMSNQMDIWVPRSVHLDQKLWLVRLHATWNWVRLTNSSCSKLIQHIQMLHVKPSLGLPWWHQALQVQQIPYNIWITCCVEENGYKAHMWWRSHMDSWLCGTNISRAVQSAGSTVKEGPKLHCLCCSTWLCHCVFQCMGALYILSCFFVNFMYKNVMFQVFIFSKGSFGNCKCCQAASNIFRGGHQEFCSYFVSESSSKGGCCGQWAHSQGFQWPTSDISGEKDAFPNWPFSAETSIFFTASEYAQKYCEGASTNKVYNYYFFLFFLKFSVVIFKNFKLHQQVCHGLPYQKDRLGLRIIINLSQFNYCQLT